MYSLKKSFKSRGSHKFICKKSEGGQEERPILSPLEEDEMEPNHERELAVKIDGTRDIKVAMEPDKKTRKEGSFEFLSEIDRKGKQQRDSSDQFYFQQEPGYDNSPAKLGEQLHQTQKVAPGEASRHLELEMEDLIEQLTPPGNGDHTEQQCFSTKELRVSFRCPSIQRSEIGLETMRRRSRDSSGEDEIQYPDEGQVLICSSNKSLIPKSSLSRSKTKSRLIDPPPMEDDTMKSGHLKSGLLGKIDEDEDDPFLDEDLPGEFKDNLSAGSIFQWLILIVILATFICTLTIPFLTKLKVWNLPLWKWEVLVLVLICGRLVSGWGIRIIVFFIERNFFLRKRLLYFVYGLRKAVQNCLWLGQVLIAWLYIFDEKDAQEIKSKTLPYVTKILVCFLVATVIWLLKTLLVKVLASSFHVSTYFDRIQDSLFNQYVIETLSGPPLVEIQNIKEEEEKVMAELQRFQNAGAKITPELRAGALSSRSMRLFGSARSRKSVRKSFKVSGILSKQQDEGITIDHIHKLNQKNISAWNMKRLIKIVRHGSLSTLDEQISNRTRGEDDSTVQIQSEFEAKAAAKRIFTNVAQHGSKYIYLVDLMRFMREDEARKTMGLFEATNETNRVNKTALKEWVVNAFRERKALSLTLNDTKTAVNKLHHMINFVVGIIIFVISLLILGIATTQILVVISSQMLLVVFIFGNTCKTVFEAIIFLFVMHPFDVGDRCEIEGVQMVVEEMNILTTVFLRYDNQKITYPNSVLSTQPIGNYYRSPDMGEAVEFCVHVSTSLEKINIMRERVKGWIEGKKEHWYPSPMIVMKDVVEMNKLQFAVWPQHRMNHQNMGERWERRACLVEEMVKIFRELDIEFRMLPIDVNLRKMPEITSSRMPSTWTTCA